MTKEIKCVCGCEVFNKIEIVKQETFGEGRRSEERQDDRFISIEECSNCHTVIGKRISLK